MSYADKIAKLQPHCLCWDHLREIGITPNLDNAERHRDLQGKIHRVDNGEVDHVAQTAAVRMAPVSEAEVQMQRKRGADL